MAAVAYSNKRYRASFIHHKKNDIVGTPQCIKDDIYRIFDIDFDPCPLDPEFDGLDPAVKWGESNFVNPPFSDIAAWLQRGHASGKQCVFLVPSRTSTQYWLAHVWPEVRAMYFFADRIQFEGYGTAFSTAMVLLLFRPRNDHVPVIEHLGHLPIRTMVPYTAAPAPIVHEHGKYVAFDGTLRSADIWGTPVDLYFFDALVAKAQREAIRPRATGPETAMTRARERLFDAGYVTIDVPLDGSCVIWSSMRVLVEYIGRPTSEMEARNVLVAALGAPAFHADLAADARASRAGRWHVGDDVSALLASFRVPKQFLPPLLCSRALAWLTGRRIVLLALDNTLDVVSLYDSDETADEEPYRLFYEPTAEHVVVVAPFERVVASGVDFDSIF